MLDPIVGDFELLIRIKEIFSTEKKTRTAIILSMSLKGQSKKRSRKHVCHKMNQSTNQYKLFT